MASAKHNVASPSPTVDAHSALCDAYPVLRCVAVCVLQCVAVHNVASTSPTVDAHSALCDAYPVLQCDMVCVLRCVAVCCHVLQCVAGHYGVARVSSID